MLKLEQLSEKLTVRKDITKNFPLFFVILLSQKPVLEIIQAFFKSLFMYKKQNNKPLKLENYWWVVLVLWILGRSKIRDQEQTTEIKQAYKPSEPETIIKEVVKPVYVDVEAVERADDVAVNVADLNKAREEVVPYIKQIEIQPITQIKNRQPLQPLTGIKGSYSELKIKPVY